MFFIAIKATTTIIILSKCFRNIGGKIPPTLDYLKNNEGNPHVPPHLNLQI